MAVRVLRVVSAVGVAVLLGVLVYRLAQGAPAGALPVGSLKGRPAAPDVRLPVIWRRAGTWPTRLRPIAARRDVSLRELRGHPVVVNFWASWCEPCKRELPRLQASALGHRGAVVFVGVDVNDFTGDARRFLSQHGVDYVSLQGGERASSAYGLIGLPETFYLDARGRVTGRTTGEASTRALETGIRAAAAG